MANICDILEEQPSGKINKLAACPILALEFSHGCRIDEEASYDDVSICPVKS